MELPDTKPTYYQANKQNILERLRVYYQHNRHTIRDKQRAYYKNVRSIQNPYKQTEQKSKLIPNDGIEIVRKGNVTIHSETQILIKKGEFLVNFD